MKTSSDNITGKSSLGKGREMIELEATKLKLNRYAVRPKGQLGTHGFCPRAWEVIYVTASSKEEAIRKAKVIIRRNVK